MIERSSETATATAREGQQVQALFSNLWNWDVLLCLHASTGGPFCRQKRRVRFNTAAALVNELVEAKHTLQLRRVLARWPRYDVIAIDEVGYVANH